MLNRTHRYSIVAIAVIALSCTVALAKEKQNVTISYLLAPERPLPEGLRAVAVIDAGVEAASAGGNPREQKWSMIAADIVESLLHEGGRMLDPSLAVADRNATRQILQERDLKLAGLVQGEQVSQAGQLLDVQALVTSRIVVNVDEQVGTKTTIDWMSIMGSAVDSATHDEPRERRYIRRRNGDGPEPVREVRTLPDGRRVVVQRRGRPEPVRESRSRRSSSRTGGIELHTRDVEEIRRHLTVQCSFSLIDAATGETIVQHSPPPYQKTDESSPDFFFGQFADSADLDPIDHFIGELVERAAREFASRIVPTRIETTYEVVGKHDEGEDGIRALRADEYEMAFKFFLANHREEPDEHESPFALGVICELAGKHDDALSFYRKALMADDLDNDDDEYPIYLAAKNRLTTHLPRIVKSEPPPRQE